MIKKAYNFLLFNYTAKKIFAAVFLSSFVQNSGVYKKIIARRISQVAADYAEAPYCVRVENTNICNARCTMCPRDKMTRPMGVMKMDIYKKIIDEASDMKIGYVNLHNFGEPLIDQEFSEKVSYAKEKGIKVVSTNSNGSLLTGEQGKKMIDSGLDKLFISIDASNKNSYEKIRLRLDYDVLVKNIRRFMHMRRKMGKKLPEVTVNFVVVKENKNEARQFIKNWKNIVDHVSISFSHDWAGEKESIRVDHSENLMPCRLLWTELTVGWNGDYLLCCQDYDGKVVLGNATDKTIAEIWQGETMTRYRKQQLSVGRRDLPLCEKCKLNTYWWF